MMKHKKVIKAEIVKLVTTNPTWNKVEILAAIMKFINRLEPWDDREIEKYRGFSGEMIDNYLAALNEV